MQEMLASNVSQITALVNGGRDPNSGFWAPTFVSLTLEPSTLHSPTVLPYSASKEALSQKVSCDQIKVLQAS